MHCNLFSLFNLSLAARLFVFILAVGTTQSFASFARSDVWYEKIRTLNVMETQKSIREIIRYQKENDLPDHDPRIVSAKIYTYIYLGDIANIKKYLEIASNLDLEDRYYFDYLHGVLFVSEDENGDREEQIEIINERIRIAERLKDKDFILQSNAQLMMQFYGGDYERALSIANFLAKELDESLTLTTKIDVNFRLAYVYMWMNPQGDKALYYFNKTLEFLLQTNNHRQIAMIYNNLGYHYRRTEDYSKSLEFMKKSLEFSILANSAVDLLWANVAVADGYRGVGQFDDAIIYYTNALAQDIKGLTDFEKTDIYERMAVTYLKGGNLEVAKHYFERVESDKNYLERIKEIRWAYESYLRTKSLILNESKEYSQAFDVALLRGDFLEKEIEKIEENRFLGTVLELENDLDKSLINDLKAQLSESEKGKRSQFYFYLLLALTFLFSIIVIVIWFNKRQKNALEKELKFKIFKNLVSTEYHRVKLFGGEACLATSMNRELGFENSNLKGLIHLGQQDKLCRYVIPGMSSEEVSQSVKLRSEQFVGLSNFKADDTSIDDVLFRSEEALLIAQKYRKSPFVIR